MLIVVGGQSRNVGKTSVIAGLIAALPEFNWTAMKITQHEHDIGPAGGECWVISEEIDCSGESDTSRFLVAGAARSLWVRTREGMLAAAMPRIREELASAENTIVESNSILEFVRPDLYLLVLDTATMDYKLSAQRFLERADALIVQGDIARATWKDSLKAVAEKPVFRIAPPPYITPELVALVRERLQEPGTQSGGAHR